VLTTTFRVDAFVTSGTGTLCMDGISASGQGIAKTHRFNALPFDVGQFTLDLLRTQRGFGPLCVVFERMVVPIGRFEFLSWQSRQLSFDVSEFGSQCTSATIVVFREGVN
jgi:hypothetical protein